MHLDEMSALESGFFLEAKMTKLRISYFGLMSRQQSLEKIIPGKVEGRRKKGRFNMR